MLFNKKALKNIEIDFVGSDGNIINALASFSIAKTNLMD